MVYKQSTVKQNFLIGDLQKAREANVEFAVPGAIAHTEKRKQRNKGLEITFDPAAHKEFVTGFRKRKNQRRKVALKSAEEKARKMRIEERKVNREGRQKAVHAKGGGEGKEEGGGGKDEVVEAVAEADEPELQAYESGGATTFVEIAPITAGGSSDEEAEEGSEDEDGLVGKSGGGSAFSRMLAAAGKAVAKKVPKGKALKVAVKGITKPKNGKKVFKQKGKRDAGQREARAAGGGAGKKKIGKKNHRK